MYINQRFIFICCTFIYGKTMCYSTLGCDIQGFRAMGLYQIHKIACCACAGNAEKVFPTHRLHRKPLVSDPGMHHGTCVTHVPWCMSGTLTCGGGENVPGIPGACAPVILRIWQEAHEVKCPILTTMVLEFSGDLIGCATRSKWGPFGDRYFARKKEDSWINIHEWFGCNFLAWNIRNV